MEGENNCQPLSLVKRNRRVSNRGRGGSHASQARNLPSDATSATLTKQFPHTAKPPSPHHETMMHSMPSHLLPPKKRPHAKAKAVREPPAKRPRGRPRKYPHALPAQQEDVLVETDQEFEPERPRSVITTTPQMFQEPICESHGVAETSSRLPSKNLPTLSEIDASPADSLNRSQNLQQVVVSTPPTSHDSLHESNEGHLKYQVAAPLRQATSPFSTMPFEAPQRLPHLVRHPIHSGETVETQQLASQERPDPQPLDMSSHVRLDPFISMRPPLIYPPHQKQSQPSRMQFYQNMGRGSYFSDSRPTFTSNFQPPSNLDYVTSPAFDSLLQNYPGAESVPHVREDGQEEQLEERGDSFSAMNFPQPGPNSSMSANEYRPSVLPMNNPSYRRAESPLDFRASPGNSSYMGEVYYNQIFHPNTR